MPPAIGRRAFLKSTAQFAAAGSVLSRTSSRGAASTRKIKIGQIGTGHAHATKLEVYRRSPDYEVVGIVEPDSQLRAAAERSPAYRELKWMSEDELLGTPGLEAVLVETCVRDSLNAAERAVAAGKHVHLDKPAGESFAQYQRLLKNAAAQKLLVQMGYMFRYSPAIVLMRRFLDEGWLGEVFEVQALMSKVVPPADRRELVEYRGGIMFELGCHVIDQVVTVLGRPDKVQTHVRHSSSIDDGLLDNMLAVFDYPNAIATVKASAIEIDGGLRRHLVVCGSQGTFQVHTLDAPRVRYSLSKDHGEYRRGTHEINFGPYERYVGDAADMAKILRGEKSCDFPYEHDLAVQETVLRASNLDVANS
jgi:predicted dehydrogenase